jgi:hypothetical protein
MEANIPKWGIKYIKYVLDILNIEDWHKRYIALCELRKLNSPAKKGIQTLDQSLQIVRETIGLFQLYDKPDLPAEIASNVVYSDNIISLLLKLNGKEPESDPYTGQYDRSSFENEAHQIGFVPMTSYLDEVERSLNFQAFLTSAEEREQRTFNQWIKMSAKFWAKNDILRMKDLEGFVLPEGFSFAKLEKQVLLSIRGWIYLGDSKITTINSGPSLKIDFFKGRFAHYRPFYRNVKPETLTHDGFSIVPLDQEDSNLEITE